MAPPQVLAAGVYTTRPVEIDAVPLPGALTLVIVSESLSGSESFTNTLNVEASLHSTVYASLMATGGLLTGGAAFIVTATVAGRSSALAVRDCVAEGVYGTRARA